MQRLGRIPGLAGAAFLLCLGAGRAAAPAVAAKAAPLPEGDVLARTLAQVGIPPGATTASACARLKTLKEKFVRQQANEQNSFQASTKEYATKICEGLGCEPDEAKRMQHQAEWQLIVKAHEKEQERLEQLLARIETIIEEPPFRHCPEFEGYLASKHQLAQGKQLLDNQQANITQSTLF